MAFNRDLLRFRFSGFSGFPELVVVEAETGNGSEVSPDVSRVVEQEVLLLLGLVLEAQLPAAVELLASFFFVL